MVTVVSYTHGAAGPTGGGSRVGTDGAGGVGVGAAAAGEGVERRTTVSISVIVADRDTPEPRAAAPLACRVTVGSQTREDVQIGRPDCVSAGIGVCNRVGKLGTTGVADRRVPDGAPFAKEHPVSTNAKFTASSLLCTTPVTIKLRNTVRNPTKQN